MQLIHCIYTHKHTRFFLDISFLLLEKRNVWSSEVPQNNSNKQKWEQVFSPLSDVTKLQQNSERFLLPVSLVQAATSLCGSNRLYLAQILSQWSWESWHSVIKRRGVDVCHTTVLLTQVSEPGWKQFEMPRYSFLLQNLFSPFVLTFWFWPFELLLSIYWS